MHNQEAVRYPRYRWAILAMAWMVQLCGTWSWFLIPSVAYALFPDLGLTQSQFTMILTAPLMVGMFITFLGGGFGDRYGIRSAVAMGAFLSGVAGLTRAFAQSFEGIFILALLMGVANGFFLPNLAKLVSIWFPPRQYGLASGIYVSAQATGFSIGLLTGPLFGGWRLAFMYVGIITLVIATLWVLLARSTPKGVEIEKAPITLGVMRGMKSRNIWMTCSIAFLIMGTFISFLGNLPKALVGVHQVSADTAGATSSLLTWGILVGTILLPAISDKVEVRKPFLYAGAVIAALCYYLAWLIAPGNGTSILIFIGGLFQGGLVAIMFTLVLELPEISPKYVGGAAGLVGSFGQMGGVLLPLLVISPLIATATLDAYTRGFTVTAILLAIIALPSVVVMETGSKGKHS